MKKALISLNEPRESGYRVAQVEDANNIFDVSSNLIWVDCADDVVSDQFWYDSTSNSFNTMPVPVIPTSIAEE